MRLLTILELVWKRGQNPNDNSSTAHSAEQRDRSSMADFVRILQAKPAAKNRIDPSKLQPNAVIG